MLYRPPRNVFLLGLTSFFNDLSSEMVLAVFPAFFVSVLKTGAASLGLVEGIADGASNIIKVYSGRWSDKMRRRKPFIIGGYGLSTLTRPLYIFTASIGGVVGLRFFDRIGKGLRDSPRDAVISLSTPKEQLGRAFGFHRAFDTLGAVAGPLVAYFILKNHPAAFNTVFGTSFVMGILSLLTIALVKEVAGEVKNKNLSFASLSSCSGNFKVYLVAVFFLSMGSIPIAVLLLKTQNIGMTIASIPLFYMVYNLSYAGFSYPAGKISDQIGSKKVLIGGCLLLIGSYVFLIFASSALSLGIAFLFLGLFPAFTDGVTRAYASDLSPAENRGRSLGLVNAVSGFGLLFAGIVGGYAWQHQGVGETLFIAGGFVLIAAVILLRVRPSVSVPSEE